MWILWLGRESPQVVVWKPWLKVKEMGLGAIKTADPIQSNNEAGWWFSQLARAFGVGSKAALGSGADNTDSWAWC